MVKILHAADLHLDSAFAALDADQSRSRRAHQRGLVQKIVELANEEKVDLILLAGDLFDSKNAYYETAEVLQNAFAKSHARIFISPGNHDPYYQESPYRSVHFSDNVHLFKSNTIERVAIPELSCVVYGAGFTGSSCPTSLLSGFRAHDDALKLMVMHGEVTCGTSKYNPISEKDIADSGLDYLALGHVHSASGVCRAGTTSYAYPGVPEGRGFDEVGEKGILIGTVSENETMLEFRKISQYLYTERNIEIKNNEMDMIFAAIPESAPYEVCRLILNGSCDKPDIETISKQLAPRFYKLCVQDRTQPIRNVWHDMEEQSIKGMFLRRLRASFENADERTREIIERAAQYGVAALENREDVR